MDLHEVETDNLILMMKARGSKVDAALEENQAVLEQMTAEYDAELKRKLAEIESFKADFASRKKAVDREGKQIQEDKENYMNEMKQVGENHEAVRDELLAFVKLVEATAAVKAASFAIKLANDNRLTSDAYENALAKHEPLARLYNSGSGTREDFKKMLNPPQKPKFMFGANNSTAGVNGFNIGKK